MLDPDRPALTSMLERLQCRATFTKVEQEALLAVPVQVTAMDAGKYLVREGEPTDGCCVLLSGSAFRHKRTRNGSRQILAVHFTGDLLSFNIGLLAVADHSIQTLSRVDVGFVSSQVLVDIVDAFPNIARALWREELVQASVAREWIINVGQRDARERIAHLVCELALRQGIEAMPAVCSIDWPLTQEQVGDATGLTSVHVNRMLQGMRAAGLISMEGRSVRIHDWAGLQAVGDFNRTYLHLPKVSGVEAQRGSVGPPSVWA